jgi:hypothetical protein
MNDTFSFAMVLFPTPLLQLRTRRSLLLITGIKFLLVGRSHRIHPLIAVVIIIEVLFFAFD